MYIVYITLLREVQKWFRIADQISEDADEIQLFPMANNRLPTTPGIVHLFVQVSSRVCSLAL